MLYFALHLWISGIVRIEILNDDAFDTTLEFDVVLEEEQNCMLDPRNSKCAAPWPAAFDLACFAAVKASLGSEVMILDDDVFPSNEHREVCAQHDGIRNAEPGQGVSPHSFLSLDDAGMSAMSKSGTHPSKHFHFFF